MMLVVQGGSISPEELGSLMETLGLKVCHRARVWR